MIVASTESGWETSALQILSEEYEAAMRDASQPASMSPATLRYFRRGEARTAELEATTADKIACRRGCSYCCHLRVGAPAHEVLVLAEAIAGSEDEAWRSGVVAALRDNAQRLHSMDRDQRYRTPLRCGLLSEEGACTAYELRPSSCRRYHSVSVDDCKTSFDNPGDLNSRIRLSSPRVAMEMSQYLGFRRGLVERGLDTAQYELNTALVEALDDMPACRARLASGQRAFVKAVVTVSSAGDVV